MKAKGKDLREIGRLLLDVPYRSENATKAETKATEKRARALAEHIIAVTDGHQHALAAFYQMARVHSLLFDLLDAEITERRKRVEL